MKEKYDDPVFFRTCHYRWAEKSSRDLSLENPPDEWTYSQCEACMYWLPLRGKFSTDWGACANEKSAFDGVVRFAHDGCDQFERIEKSEGP